jgi:predicted ATPase with chaperone activity
MLAKVLAGAPLGIDAYPVEVEVDIAQGLPQFATVGLPEGAVKESKDRIKSAIKNSGYDFPTRRITINLAPADIRKDGTAFDLPMAIGLLTATGLIPAGSPAAICSWGSCRSMGASRRCAGCCRWRRRPGAGRQWKAWWCRRSMPRRGRWPTACRSTR